MVSNFTCYITTIRSTLLYYSNTDGITSTHVFLMVPILIVSLLLLETSIAYDGKFLSTCVLNVVISFILFKNILISWTLMYGFSFLAAAKHLIINPDIVRVCFLETSSAYSGKFYLRIKCCN